MISWLSRVSLRIKQDDHGADAKSSRVVVNRSASGQKTQSITNRKSSGGIEVGLFDFGSDIRDIRIHFTFDRRDEIVDLAGFSLSHDFDPAVREIADVARNVEPVGERLASEAETHALNPAREKHSATISRHRNPAHKSRNPNDELS
jgi:hypothetical protein